MRFFVIIAICYTIMGSLLGQPQFRSWNNPDETPNQILNTYGGISDLPTIRVSEDFGPRQLG